jgi:hypothetical protein
LLILAARADLYTAQRIYGKRGNDNDKKTTGPGVNIGGSAGGGNGATAAA